jgi:hypothetical protein
VPFKQKWPDSQREKKFGSADVGVPMGRLEEMYHAFLEISAKYDQQILGMTVYNESPNKVSPSISFAIFVDDSTEESVRKVLRLCAGDEPEGGGAGRHHEHLHRRRRPPGRL